MFVNQNVGNFIVLLRKTGTFRKVLHRAIRRNVEQPFCSAVYTDFNCSDYFINGMNLPVYAVCVVHSAHKYDITLELKMTKKTKKSAINDCFDKKYTKNNIDKYTNKVYNIQYKKSEEYRKENLIYGKRKTILWSVMRSTHSDCFC